MLMSTTFSLCGLLMYGFNVIVLPTKNIDIFGKCLGPFVYFYSDLVSQLFSFPMSMLISIIFCHFQLHRLIPGPISPRKSELTK